MPMIIIIIIINEYIFRQEQNYGKTSNPRQLSVTAYWSY